MLERHTFVFTHAALLCKQLSISQLTAVGNGQLPERQRTFYKTGGGSESCCTAAKLRKAA